MSAALAHPLEHPLAHPALGHGHPVATGGDSVGSVLALAVLLALAGVAATAVADTAADPVPARFPWQAGALAASGGVHAVLLTRHVGDSALHVGAFGAVALGQLLLAALLWRRPSRRLLAAAAASSAWLVTLAVAARLAHVPGTGGRYGVGVLDLAAALLEAAVVVGCLRARRGVPAALPAPPHARPVDLGGP